MKAVKNIREAIGRRVLRNEPEANRNRRGANFNSAENIGILYLDSDEPHYNMIRNYARLLKEKFGVKHVFCLGFVNAPEKHLPVWQAQKLEMNFFTRDDLNWHLKPVKNIDKFVQHELDILIDLSGGNHLSMNYILKQSRAGMKVGRNGTRGEMYYDFLMNVENETSADKFIEQLNLYLSNPKIK